jgi:hypothetical protein
MPKIPPPRRPAAPAPGPPPPSTPPPRRGGAPRPPAPRAPPPPGARPGGRRAAAGVGVTVRFCAHCGASLLAAPAADAGPRHARSTSPLLRLAIALVLVAAAAAGAVLALPAADRPATPVPETGDPLEGVRWSRAIGTLADRPVPRQLVVTRGVAVVATGESVWALDAETGTYLWGRRDWTVRLTQPVGTPELVGAITTSGSGDRVTAIDPSSGLAVWSSTIATADEVVAVAGGLLLVGPEQTVLLGAADGEVAWTSPIAGRVTDADATTALVVVEGSDDPAVVALDLADGGVVGPLAIADCGRRPAPSPS